MSRLARLFAFCLLGCSGGTATQYDLSTSNYGDGKLLISWTIGGQPPTVGNCSGVSSLRLRLDNGGEEIEISPIPCTATRFRHDGLPSGRATLTLSGFDKDGCTIILSGTDAATLSATLPPDPAPVIALDTAYLPCPPSQQP